MHSQIENNNVLNRKEGFYIVSVMLQRLGFNPELLVTVCLIFHIFSVCPCEVFFFFFWIPGFIPLSKNMLVEELARMCSCFVPSAPGISSESSTNLLKTFK